MRDCITLHLDRYKQTQIKIMEQSYYFLLFYNSVTDVTISPIMSGTSYSKMSEMIVSL